MAFGLRGLSHIISTGCTSSTDAIAYAAEHIALGRQDAMLTGGVDAPVAPGILAGFNLMTVLTSKWNDEPERASRPFSRSAIAAILPLCLRRDLRRASSRPPRRDRRRACTRHVAGDERRRAHARRD